MADEKKNISNPFFGAVGAMFDVVHNNSYPGYLIHGDLWAEEERATLEEYCQGRFFPEIRVGNAQFVLEKGKAMFSDDIQYYAYKRSWECPPLSASNFDGVMAELLKYEPKPFLSVEDDNSEPSP